MTISMLDHLINTSSEPDHSIELFQNEWATYQELVDGNFFCHKEVIKAYTNLLQSKKLTPRSILDIGCGGCIPIPWFLIREGCCTCNTFTGVDQSQSALDLAKESAPTDDVPNLIFIRDDMGHFLRESTAKADIIMSTYTLHHLGTSASKADMLELIVDHLNPGGLFVWCDLYNSHPDENRHEMIERWKTRFWSFALSSDAVRDKLWAQASVYNFPETLEGMLELMRQAGLEKVETAWVESVPSRLHDGNVMCCVVAGYKAPAL